jgi:hypothetical protein
MLVIQPYQRTTHNLVSHYVAVRGKGGRTVSAQHAIQAIRTAQPDCILSAKELAKLIAEVAAREGCLVSYDEAAA